MKHTKKRIQNLSARMYSQELELDELRSIVDTQGEMIAYQQAEIDRLERNLKFLSLISDTKASRAALESLLALSMELGYHDKKEKILYELNEIDELLDKLPEDVKKYFHEDGSEGVITI